MTDWPDAPRLVDALERRARSIEIDVGERAAAEALLADGDVTVLRLRPEHSVEAPKRNRPVAIVAAALVLVATLALAVQRNVSSDDDVSTGPVPPTTGAPVPDARPLLPGHCSSVEPEFRSYSIGSGEVLVAGEIDRAEDAGSALVLAPSEIVRAPERVLDQLGGEDIVIYLLDATDDVVVLVDQIAPIACGQRTSVVDLGTGRSAEVACLDLGRFGLIAVDLAGELGPCAGTAATLVIDDQPLIDQQRWLDAYGCDGSSVFRLDEERNVLRTFYECDTQLLHTETSEDPFIATFDGLSLLQFIRRNVGLN